MPGTSESGAVLGLLQNHGAGRANQSLKTSYAEELPWISAEISGRFRGNWEGSQGPLSCPA